MPDPNKLEVFKEQGVHIAKTCGTCAHASFPQPRSCWGECNQGNYTHAKHGERPQPAHVTFSCPRWSINPLLQGERELGAYAELLEIT